MRKLSFLLISAMIAGGCTPAPPDRSTPKGAFARLSRCIDSASARCLFEELDGETRTTISGIHRILKETERVVESSYPEDTELRNSVFGTWLQESTAESDAAMFEILCRKHRCLKNLARGFGAIASITESKDTATVTTVRDETLVLRKSNNNWGIVLLSEALEGEQIRLSNSLAQVRRNAKEYHQQRLATGDNP